MDEFYFFLALGALLVIAEAFVGFSVIWFLFFGIACLLTALTTLIFAGWKIAILSFTIYALIAFVAMFRWVRPQLSGKRIEVSDGILNQIVDVVQDIQPGPKGGKVRFSGSDWDARLSLDTEQVIISTGESARVRAVESIVLIVEPAADRSTKESRESRT